MFKKITAFMLLMAFTNVYAAPAVIQSSRSATELNKTFDSLNYKLNVEWDQKDSAFFDQAIAGFEGEIADLQKEGLTKEELMKYTVDKIKDPAIKNDINELSKIISSSNMSDADARSFMISKLSSTYSHGASWSGSHTGMRAPLIIGAIIVILIIVHRHHTNNDPTPTPVVVDTPPCDPVPVCEYSFKGGWNDSCVY